MRLSTTVDRDEVHGTAVILAAWDAGVRLFDTAHSYGLDDRDLGANEWLLARALERRDAFIVTKGGMTRPEGKWVPDGRATTIHSQAERSAEALGRVPDLYLLHVVDPRVPWATSVRALRSLVDEGLARAVGVCNVNLLQLDQARDLAPISAVQCALSIRDDSAIRSGVLGRCSEVGLQFIAHSPLGGVRHVAKTLADPRLSSSDPAIDALAAVLAIDPCITVIPGARRVETARDCVRASSVKASKLGLFPPLRVVPAAKLGDGEVVMLMGLQGAGKSEHVDAWCTRGYTRLNRDELGGTLEALAKRLGTLLGEGTRRVVMDNTFVTRASRARVLQVAADAGVPVRGLWFDVPLHEAQVNVILRMLAAHGRLLTPEELKRGGDDNTKLPPMAQLRTLKTVELPTVDEGWAHLESTQFVRRPRGSRPAVFLAEGLAGDGVRFAWCDDDALAAPLRAQGVLVCAHGGGPPACWCRPPLPGLLLDYARNHDIDLSRSEVHGSTDPHRVMAQVLGARFVQRER